jgi:hypothetical protein
MPTIPPDDFVSAMSSRFPRRPKTPVWQGPEKDGITFSLLAKFLVCRERFRLYVIEGLRPADDFSHRIEFGNMWHVCEEGLAAGDFSQPDFAELMPYYQPLKKYAQSLAKKYPLSQEQIDHWYRICQIEFPVYVKYWSSHEDMTSRTPLLQEQVFDVPYSLPSGRTVRLRGKWDSVDLIGTGSNAGIWLMENKTKGDVDEQQLRRQLKFDLQTMMYVVALLTERNDGKGWGAGAKVKGVRYNVVRRWGSGKGAVVRHKATEGAKCPKCKGSGYATAFTSPLCPKCNGRGRIGGKPEETKEDYYARIKAIIEGNPEEYFWRWNVEVSEKDVLRFRRECLDPLLEAVCQWYDLVCTNGGKSPYDEPTQGLHYRMPFGITSGLLDGGETELDRFLADGNEVGLRRVDDLFPELK